MKNFENIKNKIFSKSNDDDKTIYAMHHALMRAYGWIPLEEFRKLPQATINNLMKEIDKENKKIKKGSKKNRPNRVRGKPKKNGSRR